MEQNAYAVSIPYITGLVLLLPGIAVLGFRSISESLSAKSATPDPATKKEAVDLNPSLIIVSLASWVIAFLGLWAISFLTESTDVAIFGSDLKFRAFVPFFGFLGAMVFVLDLFRGKKTNQGTEFALRLVMGPYVAIVMVLFFDRENIQFINLEDSSKAQAAVAFLSGFLVVLFLQAITEKGNEFLGRSREASRYSPSEIAKRFELEVSDDQRLKRDANLKYLAQLRTMSDEVLKEKGRQAGLGEGVLVEFKKQLVAEYPKHTSQLRGEDGIAAWRFPRGPIAGREEEDVSKRII